MAGAPSDDGPSAFALVRFTGGTLTIEVVGASAQVFTVVTNALGAAVFAHPSGVRQAPVLTRASDTWTSAGAVHGTTEAAAAAATDALRRAGCEVRTAD